MKKILVVALVVALLVSVAGCASPTSQVTTAPSNGKPYAGSKIVVACESGSPFTEFFKSATPEFTDQTGIEVVYFEVAHANTHDRFITEAMGGTGSIDVYQLDQPWIAEFASYGYLQEVTDEMKSQVPDFSDFTQSGLSTMSYQDKLYGLPFQYHTPVIFYRTDLFEKAGITAPPKTWDEYRDYAKRLNDPANGIYGTCLEAKAVPEPATHFLDKILQAGANYMDPDTGKATFDSQGVRDALNYYLNIQNEDKTSPEGALGYENGDVYNLFLEGKVAMVSEWPYFYAGSQDPNQSNIVGKVGIADQPNGKADTSALWAFGHGLAASSKNKNAAWLFCTWSTSSDILARFSIAQATPNPRKSAMATVMASKDVSDDVKTVLSVVDEAAAKAQPVTLTPYFPAVQDRLARSLSNVVSGASTIEEEVAATQADLEKILAGS